MGGGDLFVPSCCSETTELGFSGRDSRSPITNSPPYATRSPYPSDQGGISDEPFLPTTLLRDLSTWFLALTMH